MTPRRRFGVYRGSGLQPEVKALGWTSCLQDIASEMVYPLLPQFLLLLGGGAVALGAIESAAQGILALIKGAVGEWSDRRRRRKPFVAAGYGLSALTRPLMALAMTPFHVGAIRATDRLAKGLRTAPRDAIIGEVSGAEQRAAAFSFHRGLDHLGAAIGPLIAALVLYLAAGRLRLVFALATVPALAGWSIVQFGVRESRPSEATGPRHADRRPLSLPRALRRPLVALFLFSLGNASDAFLILRADRLGWSPIQVTILWSGFNLARWAVSAPGGRVADRIGPRRSLLAGWLVYALAYLGFAASRSAAPVVVFLALYALYYGLAEGAERALILELAGPSAGAGRVLGAFHLTTGMGTFLASLLFGSIWELASPAAAFITGAVLSVGAGIVFISGQRRPPAESMPTS
jgi:MFS family permease